MIKWNRNDLIYSYRNITYWKTSYCLCKAVVYIINQVKNKLEIACYLWRQALSCIPKTCVFYCYEYFGNHSNTFNAALTDVFPHGITQETRLPPYTWWACYLRTSKPHAPSLWEIYILVKHARCTRRITNTVFFIITIVFKRRNNCFLTPPPQKKIDKSHWKRWKHIY